MKNKRYRVWTAQGYSVDIDAKEIRITYLGDEPLNIKFVCENDYTLAEFYCNMISGWAEVKCLVDIRIEPQESEDLGDYPDAIHNQFDNMTGSMNL